MNTPRLIADLTGEGFQSRIMQLPDGRVQFNGDADIDADGAPHAYHPRNIGLDDLANAKDKHGVFVGVLTSHGNPILQAEGDPAPGYYISTTSYQFRTQPMMTQRRYVNAEMVPFIVVPPAVIFGVSQVVLGCRALVTNMRTQRSVPCVVADIGPKTRTGELSIAAAKAMGINSDARRGGDDAPIYMYELWPGQPAEVAGITFELQPVRLALA